ncbi:MAG TPA: peptidylprolyl isomerase [Spirochaetia bacterium]|nr:peptidylprolyl isomerase [Spirochaetia bacterium]
MKKIFLFVLGILLFSCGNANAQKPVVILETNIGEIQIELYPDKAPLTVKNFIKYVNYGFYDNTIFHRVINGFMIQGGGYTPELKAKDTYPAIKNEADNGLSNTIGTIAMARTSVVDSATSQFFINVADNRFLDYKSSKPEEYGYCVFGKVVKGMEVVTQIKNTMTRALGPFQNLPVQNVIILKVKLVQ